MGKARTFSDSSKDAVYQKEYDDQIYSASVQQNSYNLGSTHFSDQSGIGNFTQAGSDQRKANLKGALFTGNVGFDLQTAILDVPSNTINLLEDNASAAVSLVSTDKIVSLSAGTTADLITITGAQRPGQRLTLYGIFGNTITIKHTAAATDNTILTPNGNDFIVLGDMVVQLVYDITTAKWRIISGTSSGGGGIAFPLLYPKVDLTPAASSSQSIDLSINTGNAKQIQLPAGDISLQIVGDPANTVGEEVHVLFIQDAIGGRSLTSVDSAIKNGSTMDTLLDKAANAKTMFKLVTLDGGVSYHAILIDMVTGSDTPWTENHDAAGFTLDNLLSLDVEDSGGATKLGISGPLGVGARFSFVSGDSVIFTENITDRLTIDSTGLNIHSGDIAMGAGGNIVSGGAGEGLTNTGHIDFIDNLATPGAAVSLYSDGTDAFFNTGGGVKNISNLLDSLTPWTVNVDAAGFQLDNLLSLDVEDSGGTTKLSISGPLGVGARFAFVPGDTVFFTENITDIISINASGLNILGALDITMGTGNIAAGGAGEGMTNTGHIDFIDNLATPAAAVSLYSDGTDLIANTGGGAGNVVITPVVENLVMGSFDITSSAGNGMTSIGHLDFLNNLATPGAAVSLYSDGTDLFSNTGGGVVNLSDIAPQTPWTSNIDAAGFQLDNLLSLDIEDSAGTTKLAISGPLGIGARFSFVSGDTVFFTENITNIISIDGSGLNVLGAFDLTMGTGNIVAGGTTEGVTNIGHLDFIDNLATPAAAVSLYSDGTDLIANTGGGAGNVFITPAVENLVMGSFDITSSAGNGMTSVGHFDFIDNIATPGAALSIYSDGTDLLANTGGGVVNFSDIGGGGIPHLDGNGATTIIENTTDPTKDLRFNLAPITTASIKTISFVGGGTATYTFQSTGGLIAAIDLAQTWSADQTYSADIEMQLNEIRFNHADSKIAFDATDNGMTIFNQLTDQFNLRWQAGLEYHFTQTVFDLHSNNIDSVGDEIRFQASGGGLFWPIGSAPNETRIEATTASMIIATGSTADEIIFRRATTDDIEINANEVRFINTDIEMDTTEDIRWSATIGGTPRIGAATATLMEYELGSTGVHEFINGSISSTFIREAEISMEHNTSVGGIFEFFRNDSTPTDFDLIGLINFTGNVTGPFELTYCNIVGDIIDNSATVSKGALRFRVVSGGATLRTGIEISGQNDNANGVEIGFFGETPVVQQNPASDTLANLYIALRNLGLLV